ncbi:MAG: bifunctional phosphopantothenoylcysteine decarboxylase/phosphopantothenate--cysteine ligase CoaBC [Bdellovibrionales bacterium]
MAPYLNNRRILLIISGGIAAYKSLELIRRLRDAGAKVRCILTSGGAQFVTPLSVAALSEEQVYSDLWSLTDENRMGHIRLAREADLVVVAPASANLIARMAQGLADDLASTVLLATDKPVIIAPAMNVVMWQNPATQANVATIQTRGIRLVGPASGMMACGEEGEGRMMEPAEILSAISRHFSIPGPLAGKRALVTAGPTYEPLDPVRFIGNRSSGKQGFAIAEALHAQGAVTTLVTGPARLPDPAGIKTIRVETAREMLDACEAALPADIAVCTAAVADWRPAEFSPEKMKKGTAKTGIELVENPDILATLAKAGNRRPRLVIGFAAETGDVIENAKRKFGRKNCDWILANDVADGKGFDAGDNEVALLRRGAKGDVAVTNWPRQSKEEIARQLAGEIAAVFKTA